MISVSQLKERKLGQWAITYLAAGWLLLQAIDLIGGYFAWPARVGQLATVLLSIGFLGVLVLAWYHGDKGQQRVSGPELVMIAALLLIAGVGVAFVTPTEEAAPDSLPDAASAFIATAPVAEQGSIAVLPFTDMSPERDQEYFSDGITEELLNVLAQLPELRVASRTSAFSFKGKDVAIDSVARALRVRHVLEGSVRKAGDRVRITAQLIDASTGYHLWSETYDRDLRDIFAVQDEISREIVRQLQIELSGGRGQGRLARVETTDPEAHTLVLKAQQMARQSTRESVAEAETLVEQALSRDPEYAQAHAWLATIYSFQAVRRWISPEDGYVRAAVEADRALALNPAEARAHMVLGQIAERRDWDWAAAERHYARAIATNPGFAPAYDSRANLLVRLGRTEEALESARRALQLDPIAANNYNNAANVYRYAGQLERAREMYEEALRLGGVSAIQSANLSISLSELGRHAEAVRAAEQAIEAASGYPGALSALGYAHARAGNRPQAERALARLESLPEVTPYHLAEVHAGLENRDRVIALLERAVDERDPNVLSLGVEPLFREYLREPRVQRLLTRINLPSARS